MWTFTRIFVVSIATAFLACGNAPPVENTQPHQTSELIDVDFCELVGSPEEYLNRSVQVRAILCDCFENSEIYSVRCGDAKSVWVEGGRKPCSAEARFDSTRRELADNPGEQNYGSWNFGVVAIGRLDGVTGGYGHMNAFDYRFEIDCLEHHELLDKKGFRPQASTPEFERIRTFEAK
jgi:hypothetical protein